MRRTVGTAGVGAAFATLMGSGLAGGVIFLAVVLTIVGAVCWVVADPDRPARLALLITTWRTRTPPGRRPAIASRAKRPRTRSEPQPARNADIERPG